MGNASLTLAASRQRQPTEGYQKFVGLEVELEEAHGLERPILMDGRVPQTDGLRFVYILPLGPRRLLVEDTYFSDHPQLDEVSIADEVQAYIRQNGWRVLSSAAASPKGCCPAVVPTISRGECRSLDRRLPRRILSSSDGLFTAARHPICRGGEPSRVNGRPTSSSDRP